MVCWKRIAYVVALPLGFFDQFDSVAKQKKWKSFVGTSIVASKNTCILASVGHEPNILQEIHKLCNILKCSCACLYEKYVLVNY